MDNNDSGCHGYLGQVAYAVRCVTTPIAAIVAFAIVLFGMLWLVSGANFDSPSKGYLVVGILVLLGVDMLGFFLLCAIAPHILTFDKDAHLQKIAFEFDVESLQQLPMFLSGIPGIMSNRTLAERLAKGMRDLESSAPSTSTSNVDGDPVDSQAKQDPPPPPEAGDGLIAGRERGTSTTL
jgi:hypothetical protein